MTKETHENGDNLTAPMGNYTKEQPCKMGYRKSFPEVGTLLDSAIENHRNRHAGTNPLCHKSLLLDFVI